MSFRSILTKVLRGRDNRRLREQLEAQESLLNEQRRELERVRRRCEISEARLNAAEGHGDLTKTVLILNAKIARRFAYFARVYTLLRGVEGTIVEAGVFRGASLLMFAHLAQKENADRMIWGFDSFEGLPEPTPEDASQRDPQAGQLRSNLDEVWQLFSNHGFTSDEFRARVRLVKGFFEQSLSQYPGDPIALLHIDADLYQSNKVVLEQLYPLVVSGGLVLFDEYVTNVNWPGAARAIDEYFEAAVSEIRQDPESGKYYMVKE